MKTLKEIYDERVEGFDKKFGIFEIGKLNENLFVPPTTSYRQITLALLENMVKLLEERKKPRLTQGKPKKDYPCGHAQSTEIESFGYNTAIDDTIKYLKEQIELINNN